MWNVPIILILSGILLIICGLAGGGLELRDFKIPKFAIVARLVAGVTGAALVMVGASLGAFQLSQSVPQQAGQQRQQQPVPTSAVQPVSNGGFDNTSGGLGDTTANPDAHYVCGGQLLSDDGSTTLIYFTAAGGDEGAANSFCERLVSNSHGRAFLLAHMHVPGRVPGCYLTSQDGGFTARLYTAPDGDDSTTQQVCMSLLQGAGIAG
jgi:hypothetical protein